MQATNPFTNQFVVQEASFYGLSSYKNGTVQVKTQTPEGRLDDYLNVNFVTDHPPVPALFVDGSLWMSLTRAELQGQYVAINMAKGKVGIGGLGLGYVVLRMVDKEEVTNLDVYEINPAVISFFKKKFKNRNGFQKINFVEGDIRETLVNKKYDLFFNDIYKTLLPDEVISDVELFRVNNKIKNYRFWGMELCQAVLLNSGIRVKLNDEERKFFRFWRDTPLYEGADYNCANMKLVFHDVDFAESAISATRAKPLGIKI